MYSTQYRDPAKPTERGPWVDHIRSVTLDTEPFPQPENCDLYFTPLRFTADKRSNAHVGKPGVFFADLDPVHPESLALRPTFAWATSVGSYQAVWALMDVIESYDEWASINRSITHHTGADPGGWMGSKVLRVPGSINYKRGSYGRLLWADGPVYEKGEVVSVYPVVKKAPTLFRPGSVDEDYPAVPAQADAAYLATILWPRMGLRGRSMLMKRQVPDRSLHIVRTIHELAKTLDPDEVFRVIWWRPWNKWRLNDKPEMLWAEIQKAIDA